MGVSVNTAVQAIADNFASGGQCVSVQAFSRGHINDSYVVTCQTGAGTTRFLLQRINAFVFRTPALVMENIQRITAHLARGLAAERCCDAERRALMLVPTHTGAASYCDAAGEHWRLFRYIEDTHGQLAVTCPEQAYAAGRAFGEFQSRLADLPAPRLHETIPDFHNTPRRLEALEAAAAADVCGRVAAAESELTLARAQHTLAGTLCLLQRAGLLPERVAHNDAKIDNVLFDATTGEALCVVDLDTVMPGPVLYDFGDMMRSMISRAAEDEQDLSRVEVELPLFEALAQGYLDATHTFLTQVEREHLVLSGQLITFEQGVRFLTDFLAGDRYYKTQRPRHNLDRCRAQFRLFESMVSRTGEMNAIVAKH